MIAERHCVSHKCQRNASALMKAGRFLMTTRVLQVIVRIENRLCGVKKGALAMIIRDALPE
jgi:hypothetical protein